MAENKVIDAGGKSMGKMITIIVVIAVIVLLLLSSFTVVTAGHSRSKP